MPKESEQRAQEIFEHAITLTPLRRSAFLDEACAGDAELRRLVGEFLAQEDHHGVFLEGGGADGRAAGRPAQTQQRFAPSPA